MTKQYECECCNERKTLEQMAYEDDGYICWYCLNQIKGANIND